MARLTRAERAAQTKAELLEAAAVVFAKCGYTGASIADIAEEAGYSHGAVYSNFDSKQELFFELFAKRTDETVDMITTFFAAAPGTFADKCTALAHESTRRLREDPDAFLLSLEFCTVAARNAELRARFADRIAAIPVKLGEMLKGEQKAGRLRGDINPHEFALGLHALGVGLGIDYWIVPHAVRPGLYGDLVGHLLKSVTE